MLEIRGFGLDFSHYLQCDVTKPFRKQPPEQTGALPEQTGALPERTGAQQLLEARDETSYGRYNCGTEHAPGRAHTAYF